MATVSIIAGSALVAGVGISSFLGNMPKYPKREGSYAVALEGTTDAYRHPDHVKPQTTTGPGQDTLYAVAANACEKFADRNALGTRDVISCEIVGGFEKFTLGPEYKWITYKELGERINNFASGLIGLTGMKAGDKMTIYADTKAHWMVAAQGAFSQSLAVVTVYATLGAEGVEHGLNQTRSPVVVADGKLLKTLVTVAGKCPYLKYIITMDDVPADMVAKLKGIKVISMKDVEAQGAAKPKAPVPPKASDLAVIMYTSGTTGNAKGVMISHANAISSLTGLAGMAEGKISESSVYIGYLPLAHIMELAAENLFLGIGAAIGYGSPHTLTDNSPKIKVGACRGDAPTLCPTFMVMAPAVADKIRTALGAKISAAPPGKQKLFGKATAAGEARWEASHTKGFIGNPFFWNTLVFKKVQALLGGRVSCIISGSAPLSKETQRFVEVAFNCPVRQGYGLTETCSAATIATYDNGLPNQVGSPLSSTIIRLRDWDEGNYRIADANDPAIGVPRGEVLVGGPVVSLGYYNPEYMFDAEIDAKNKSDYTTIDGVRYFCTGDVGQMTADGCLQIIDRKKDLVKLQQGEYVALSKVEAAIKLCPLVDNAMSYALGSKSHTIALVCPFEATFMAWAKKTGRDGKTMAELCKDPAVVAEVSKMIADVCKGKLAKFEVPKVVGLVADPWTPDNDCLTAAMKLKRIQIVNRHKAELADLYAK